MLLVSITKSDAKLNHIPTLILACFGRHSTQCTAIMQIILLVLRYTWQFTVYMLIFKTMGCILHNDFMQLNRISAVLTIIYLTE